MGKSEVINLRVDSNLKEDFCKIVEKEGYTVSATLTACMRDVVTRKKIPLNLIGNMGEKNNKQKVTIHKIKELVDQYIFENTNCKIQKVYLFGSFSRGEETSESDIDLHLFVNNDFGMSDMGKFSLFMESKTNRKIDLIFNDVEGSFFIEELAKDEICLYEQR